jgi:hypothetical protein
MNYKKHDCFIQGYKAAKRLREIWDATNQRYICFATPFGMDFFDKETTSPCKAVKLLKDEYDVPYLTVAKWIEETPVSAAQFTIN